jgi:protein O-GlcNAc transferase
VVKQYKKALMINPNYAEAHSALGSAYVVQGHLDEAEEECQQAIKKSPDFGKAHFNLGMAYLAQNRLTEAANEYFSPYEPPVR